VVGLFVRLKIEGDLWEKIISCLLRKGSCFETLIFTLLYRHVVLLFIKWRKETKREEDEEMMIRISLLESLKGASL